MADADTGQTTDEQGRKPAGRLAKARRVAVAVALLTALFVVWFSFLTSHLQTCDDQVAEVGRAALVKSCRPMTVTDAPILALLIVAGLLLWPELAALEIFGVFRLERRIEAQAKRQEDIVTMIHRLEVSISQQQSQEQRTQVNLNLVSQTAARAGELAVLQDEKREQFESDAP